MPMMATSAGTFYLFGFPNKRLRIDLLNFLNTQLIPIPAIILTAGASTNSNRTMTEAK